MAAPSLRAAARHFRRRHGGARAVQDRTCAALAEQLLGLFPSDADADATWQSAWREFGSLPPAVAGTSRQLALMPVVAAHRGTYFSYTTSWAWAAAVWPVTGGPLLAALGAEALGDGGDGSGAAAPSAQEAAAARAALEAVMSLDARGGAGGALALLNALADSAAAAQRPGQEDGAADARGQQQQQSAPQALLDSWAPRLPEGLRGWLVDEDI